jgi:hypothetical protein
MSGSAEATTTSEIESLHSASPNPDVASEEGHNATRPSKKRKAAYGKTHDDIPPICPLGSVPLELLAEIMSYTTPRDVLALARTSKYFCATLVSNPACEFIWKRARARFEPTIPAPTPNFTEPAYAAFLFDSGVCEVSCPLHHRSLRS